MFIDEIAEIYTGALGQRHGQTYNNSIDLYFIIHVFILEIIMN